MEHDAFVDEGFYEGSCDSQALHKTYSPGALEFEMEKHSRKMTSGGHFGFGEFLDFDQFDTETRLIPLIALVLGRWIHFWCWNYVCKIQDGRQK